MLFCKRYYYVVADAVSQGTTNHKQHWHFYLAPFNSATNGTPLDDKWKSDEVSLPAASFPSAFVAAHGYTVLFLERQFPEDFFVY